MFSKKNAHHMSVGLTFISFVKKYITWIFCFRSFFVIAGNRYDEVAVSGTYEQKIFRSIVGNKINKIHSGVEIDFKKVVVMMSHGH